MLGLPALLGGVGGVGGIGGIGGAVGASAPPSGDDAVVELVAELGAVGIETWDTPTSGPRLAASEPVSPVRLLIDQVVGLERDLASGGALDAAALDAEVGGLGADPDVPDDLVAAGASQVVTDWARAGASPAARLAATVLGDASRPTTSMPLLVPLLLLSDLATVSASLPAVDAPPDTAPAGGLRSIGRDQGAGPAARTCSQVVGFVDSVLATVADFIGHLPRRAEVSIGVDVLDTALSALGTAVFGAGNFLIDGAELVIGTVVRVPVRTVLSFVGRIASIAGTVGLVVSAIRPWSVRVQAQPAELTNPDAGQFAVSVGIDDRWPGWATDCASAAGVPLPPLVPSGNPVTWTVVDGGLITATSIDRELDGGGSARYAFQVTAPPPDPDRPPFRVPVPATVDIQRDDITRYEQGLIALINAQLQGLLPPIGTLVSPLVLEQVKPSLDSAFRLLGTLRMARGIGVAVLLTRDPQDEDVPSSIPSTAPSDKDAFCAYLTEWSQPDPGSIATMGSEGLAMVSDIAPITPPEMVANMSTLATFYAAAADGDYAAIASSSEAFGAAWNEIFVYCGVVAPE